MFLAGWGRMSFTRKHCLVLEWIEMQYAVEKQPSSEHQYLNFEAACASWTKTNQSCCQTPVGFLVSCWGMWDGWVFPQRHQTIQAAGDHGTADQTCLCTHEATVVCFYFMLHVFLVSNWWVCCIVATVGSHQRKFFICQLFQSNLEVVVLHYTQRKLDFKKMTHIVCLCVCFNMKENFHWSQTDTHSHT